MLTYSFIKHPIGNTLNNCSSLFPGIKEAYAIYSNYSKEIIVKRFFHEDIEKVEIEQSILVQKFRKKKQPFIWLKSDEIHFITGAKKSRKKHQQLTLMDEDKTVYLAIKHLSPIDHLYDVIIFKLEDSSVFGMSKSGNSFNAQSKLIIGNLLTNAVKAKIKSEYENNETHRLVLNNIKNQQKNLTSLTEENEMLRNNYKKSILYFISNVLKRVSDKFEITVSLSDKARTYLLDLDVDIETLEKVIIQSAHMAANLTLEFSKTIMINPEHIIIDNKEDKIAPITQNDKHGNVIEILDKYEHAAELARAKEWKINGNTVAQLCSPAITPSAITFNLKKYKKAINILMDRYDEKWPLLRTHFKPLKNIIEIKTSELSKYKTA